MNERYLEVTREGRAGCDQAVTGGNRRDPHIPRLQFALSHDA